MENLIKQLQTEVGLTEDQAVKALVVIKKYADKENISINWDKFFKGKYEEYKEKYKTQIDQISKQLNNLTDKVLDKVEDATIQTKRAARDFTKKIYDKLDD